MIDYKIVDRAAQGGLEQGWLFCVLVLQDSTMGLELGYRTPWQAIERRGYAPELRDTVVWYYWYEPQCKRLLLRLGL